MDLLNFVTTQPQSALLKVVEAGVAVGETVEMELVTGITLEHEPGTGRRLVMAHFCSSRWHRRNQVNTPPLILEPRGVKIHGAIPRVPKCAFMQGTFQVTLGAEGLLLARPQKLRVADIPPELQQFGPWGYTDGGEEVARSLGFESLDDWINTSGRELVLN